MKKKIVLMNWLSDSVEGVTRNFETSGWNVELNAEDNYSSYTQVLKKSPAVLMCCSDGDADQVRGPKLEKMCKRKISVPVFGLL